MAAAQPKVEIISDKKQWIEGKNASVGDKVMCDKKDAAYLVGRERAHYPDGKDKVKTDDLHHVGRRPK